MVGRPTSKKRRPSDEQYGSDRHAKRVERDSLAEFAPLLDLSRAESSNDLKIWELCGCATRSGISQIVREWRPTPCDFEILLQYPDALPVPKPFIVRPAAPMSLMGDVPKYA